MSPSKTTEAEEQHVQFSTNVGYFDKYLEALEAFRDEGIVVFTDSRIFSKVVDPANVAMCVSKIEGQALNSLKLQSSEQMKAGLRFEKIRDCLSGTSNTSELEVTWPVTSTGKRMIRLDIIDEDIQFEVSALDPDAVPDIPQKDPLSHSTRIVVDGTDFKKTINHADKIADDDSGSLIFETFDGVFQLRASDKVEGRFVKKFHQSGPSEDGGLGEHKTEISMDFLDDIAKLTGRGDEVTVHIKDRHPVRLDIDLDDKGDAQVVYLIAPRIEKQG